MITEKNNEIINERINDDIDHNNGVQNLKLFGQK